MQRTVYLALLATSASAWSCGATSEPQEQLETPAICELPIETGPCFASMPRWGFDTSLGACREFVYGGCEGNENNFESEAACEARCEAPTSACGGPQGLTCANTAFCDYPATSCGAADQSGVCAARPDNCPAIFAPVCGCDGVTYGNVCAANAAGVDIASNQACGTNGDVCGGPDRLVCGVGEYCDYPGLTCGAGEVQGECRARPEVCTREYDPVCGCDGNTYGNACGASAAGVDVSYRGECSTSKNCGGWSGPTCTAQEFCDFPVDGCDFLDQGGTCRPRPSACPEILAPVCGCNSVTYDNECFAHAVGIDAQYSGACR